MKYHYIICILFLSACANQTAPTGGPKDITPPSLISSEPQDQAINVSSKTIELEFDEYVKLDKAKEQIIISPNFDSDIEYKSRKNKVFIEFEDNLPDSTTFTINFREGIKDITEGNSPKDLKLAFSTGPYLDSLSITGSVKDLLTDKASDNHSLFLYNVNDTLNIFEDTPLYFTRTNKKGEFRFENIKQGTYNIYSLKDVNKNLKLDLTSEPYGFIDTVLVLNDSLTDINLKSNYFNIEQNEIKSARQNGTTFEIKILKYVTDYNLIYSDSLNHYSNFIDKEHKSIQVFNYNFSKDSVQTILEYKDSTRQILTDTLYIKFEETLRKPSEFKMETALQKVFPSDGVLEGQIKFNKPIVSINYDSIYLFLDSLHVVNLDSSHLIPNKFNDEFQLKYNIDKTLFEVNSEQQVSEQKTSKVAKTSNTTSTQKPHLYQGKSAFISAELDSSVQKSTNLTFTKLDEFGTILLDIKTSLTNYQVQLLTKDYKIIQEKPGNTKLTFNKVSPGEYLIRILVDKNLSGHWDPGNINYQIVPEPVYFYSNDEGKKEFTIRANWELGPLEISF